MLIKAFRGEKRRRQGKKATLNTCTFGRLAINFHNNDDNNKLQLLASVEISYWRRLKIRYVMEDRLISAYLLSLIFSMSAREKIAAIILPTSQFV